MFDVLGRIKELREARNWSVYKLALLSGIPQSTIATWYQKNLCPPIDKLEILCNVFDITLAEFFSTEEFSGLSKEHSELLQKWMLLGHTEKNALTSVINAFINQPR
ncbi:helix-turn-helix domain-containing protein [Clostridium transplantifaecale]|uniref:helix-turn-helix domain-containing protein n=1 Tax=Clostridium transplantifaecale TaxID=2479838 RepID=UPI000F62DC71|nr:helix-turn-helix transcriptional regulator [Clostridium transplantifaecale]